MDEGTHITRTKPTALIISPWRADQPQGLPFARRVVQSKLPNPQRNPS